MHIKELTMAEFNAFSESCPLGSYHQSSNYALFMAENNFEYDLIGYVDELGIIKAAALILIKKINISYKYGYSPKGLLIDYFDYNLLASFTNDLRKYYDKKLVFIKINPEIAIGEINQYSKITNYNQNIIIRDYLKGLGFCKLKDNLYFESIIPRFNAIVNLDEYSFDKLAKNTRNKIRKAEKKGLTFNKVSREESNSLYNLLEYDMSDLYFKSYYNVFEKSNMCDLFLIKIDYEKYLINSKNLYDEELVANSELSEKLIYNSSELNINQKMNSDKTLLGYKNDIEIASLGLKKKRETAIAGAFVIKYQNRISIISSGYDKKFKHFNANYYLYYKIIEFYKDTYKFVDLNGITGDFSNKNPFKGLNNFKFGFNPHIYEFIGEFDFVINEKAYRYLNKKGILAKEFNPQ